jgi:hypothetical protein
VDDYPVKVRIEYPERSSRGWAVLTILLIKFLALVPHGIVLFALGIAAAVVFVIAQIAVLARGVFPPGLFSFLTGYIRWYTRVEGFLLSVTDRYPPFSLESDPNYPVDVEVEYPKSSSKTLAALSLLFVVIGIVVFAFSVHYFIDRATPSSSSWRYNWSWYSNGGDNPFAIFRLILLIPHIIIVAILGIAVAIIWFIVQWVILFVARYPQGMHKFVAQWMGWAARVAVYSNGLTDRYPPFSLETVEWGAAAPAAGAPPAPPPPPLPPAPAAPEDRWVDDRFPAPPAGAERTTELPPAPPETEQPAAPPGGEPGAPPQPPSGEAGVAPPQAPGGETGEAPPEPPGGRPGSGPHTPPATGPSSPPTPPPAPPPQVP